MHTPDRPPLAALLVLGKIVSPPASGLRPAKLAGTPDPNPLDSNPTLATPRMPAGSLPPDAVTFAAAITANAKAVRWEMAVDLLQHLLSEQLTSCLSSWLQEE